MNDLYQSLLQKLESKPKIRFREGDLGVWITHEKLVNMPEGQIKIIFGKYSDPKYHEQFSILKDGAAYQWDKGHNDDRELAESESAQLKSRVENILESGEEIE
jgi:hypothetical protein